jgi:hypothetical protein
MPSMMIPVSPKTLMKRLSVVRVEGFDVSVDQSLDFSWWFASHGLTLWIGNFRFPFPLRTSY